MSCQKLYNAIALSRDRAPLSNMDAVGKEISYQDAPKSVIASAAEKMDDRAWLKFAAENAARAKLKDFAL